MSYTHAAVKNLTEAEKDRILTDLVICLQQDRLLDSSSGWEVTKGGKGVRPQRMRFSTYRGDISAPSWQSLSALVTYDRENPLTLVPESGDFT